MGPTDIDPKLKPFAKELVSECKRRKVPERNKLKLAEMKLHKKKLKHEQAVWELEWTKLTIDQLTKKVETTKYQIERAEQDQNELNNNQGIKNQKKRLKIDLPRQRINPVQNTNQNQTFTNFSAGKRSVEKMDQETIMAETKKQDLNIRQLAENSLNQRPLLEWEDTTLKINPDQFGFTPDFKKLDEYVKYNDQKVSRLSPNDKIDFDNYLPWIILAKSMIEMKNRENQNNMSTKKN